LQRFAALGVAANATLPDQLPKPILQIDEVARVITQQKYGIKTIKPIIALCPGAEFGPSKRWPAEYFAEVANYYLQQHWQVVLFGSAKDQVVAEEIQSHTHHCCLNLCGKTTLAEAIDLMSLVRIVITNDSGLMHIAAALDKSIIALYGSTDPGFTPPLSHKARIFKLSLDCQPCFQRTCPLKHHRCMQDLLPQKIIEASAECEF
jgi:heptosyltransferase-2